MRIADVNEFLEQFLIEARELVEQATGDLLALEEQPDDKERLDSAFRAIHTLKGAAGIVEFGAMGRVMHAAEDVLSNARAGADLVSATLVGDCLASLDQVVQWLDAMQRDGELPAGAETQADAVVARFGHFHQAKPITRLPAPADSEAWPNEILAHNPGLAVQARTAVRFTPDADCFFKGDDPLARVARIPGLLALDISGTNAWPPLDDFDPFRCRMVITALASCTSGEAAPLFEAFNDQVEICDLTSGAESNLSPAARTLIDAQIRLLRAGTPDGFAGRLDSAARVGIGTLRRSGRDLDIAALEKALTESHAAGGSQPLVAALRDVLTQTSSAAPIDAAEPRSNLRPNAREVVTRVRVDVERIDQLAKLVAELTVVKNAVAHVGGLAEAGADPKAVAASLKEQTALLNRLMSQLQGAVLSLRVLPLRHVFQRFPKLVREMAASVGKPARLVTEGDSTEADKTVVEALFEPLLHVLRNAVDHGVESAQERVAAGKPESATIYLRARRQGENLIIEVADDGRGVDVDRVRAVALERGVASADALAAMNRTDLIDLIFEPGFSTAASVSDLSGRGVGMDAVRAAVSRLGGHVQIDSLQHRGSTVHFTLPFSVMMTKIMTVEIGERVFGIAFDSVVETVSLLPEQVMPLGADRAFILRERTVPLLNLGEYLGLYSTEPPRSCAYIVVASVNGSLTGLQVDRIGGRMEIMLQPMEGLLSDMPGIAGTTLLGDGRVLLVLDLEDLLR